jgi:tricorn protease
MRSCLSTVVVVCLFSCPLRAQDETRLLRFPAIHGDQVVFTYAGNLYTVPSRGGIARKLTNHDGFEMFARFSPDGKWLAFTGQYDGNTEVYLMPAEGGVPKRLTFTATLARDDVSDRMGPNNIVMGWTPDGRDIIIRSRMREHNDFLGQLFLVSTEGVLPRQLPLPRGGFCSFSPDGKKLAYNRVFREFRTWKRYRGGMADDIWIYDFDTKKTDNITKNPAQDIIPMWHGNRIYFLSDRDEHKRMNLYVYDLESGSTRQLTHFTDFDIKFPSLGDGAIVFENAGYLYRYDLMDQKATRVPVRILEDQVGGRGGIIDVRKNIESYEISPDGKRALFSARGDLFTVPAKHGPTRNLTASPGVHDRDAQWSPDGKLIAYISDASGEDEIYVLSQDGSGSPRQLTTNGDTYKYALRWSPDGKKILWSDKKLRLQYVDVASKATKLVTQATAGEIRDYQWSPDSKWIAYARPEEEGMPKVYLYSVGKEANTPVTDMWYLSSHPVFSGDGKYLFFTSNRDFNPLMSGTEWNHTYQDMARIYLVTLAKDTPSPLAPKSDEVDGRGDGKPATEDSAAQPEKKGKKKDQPGPGAEGSGVKDLLGSLLGKASVKVRVDLDGIQERVLQLPVPPGSYQNLQSVGSTIYYLRSARKKGGGGLFAFDLGSQKETAILSPAEGYEISGNGRKMLVHRGETYAIIDLPKGPATVSDGLDLSGLQVKLDRHAEWRQIFNESWRQMRDFFYAPNLHGVDWKAVRARYEPLVAHVNHRADLTYILGEMIGELNTGHTYVGGGDMPHPARIATGLLGAQLEQDPGTKFYRITKILEGANWDKNLRSPLTEIGVNVKKGDYILAVNGQPTSKMTNIYELLVNTAGKQVRLKVNSQPSEKGSREVTVVPISDEAKLYYYDWVEGNIKKVAEATGGKVGYLHIPDMQTVGLNEFVKHYYPQLRKQGLIIDVRGNGGGNVSPQIIERLRRTPAMTKMARNVSPSPDPGGMPGGPMVCLLNEFSASDGDLFPYRFKTYKLGKLIGKRSWGGVIGIRGSLPFLDGGFLNKPEFGTYSADGKDWIIEGHGVDPDIVVDNDPAREYAGIDDQLNKAIGVILEEIRTKERRVPPIPAFPVR